jgi:fucose permease
MPSTAPISYKSTAAACYVGNFVQATVINLTPILFIPLREAFGFSYEQLGFLIFINFFTQVLVDIGFSTLVDRYGFRRFVVAAHALTVIGFGLFALAPALFSDPYTGFVIATIIFSGSGGLLELLLSPIVNAIPTDEKAAAMSVLHSFYAWGQVTVVLLTTLFLFAFGKSAWMWVMVLWTLPAIFNFFYFQRVPLGPAVPEEHRQGMRQLILNPFFVVAFFTIMLGAAAEICISQWTSAFMEKGLDLPKVVGDIAGMSMFGFTLGVGRLLYGTYGKRVNVNQVMISGAALAVVCYLVVALSTVSLLSLAACAACGFMVSLLWPGTLVIAAERFPLAGAWLFAILAAGGDIGAAAGPWLMSVVTEHAPRLAFFQALGAGLSSEQLGLRLGMLLGALFPLGAVACLVWLYRASRPAAAFNLPPVVVPGRE